MTIAWEQFTPWSSLAGGMLIGLAAALLLLFNGRVAGVSGIIGGLLRPSPGDIGWRLAFLSGLVLAPAIFGLVTPLPTPIVEAGWVALVAAGLLVGFGARYGSGCTSGHGVCGISRGSPRSLVATALFMSAGFVTVHVVRYLAG